MSDTPELWVESESTWHGIVDVACWVNEQCDKLGVPRVSATRDRAHFEHARLRQGGVSDARELRRRLSHWLHQQTAGEQPRLEGF